jgi:hypothetical protein
MYPFRISKKQYWFYKISIHTYINKKKSRRSGIKLFF